MFITKKHIPRRTFLRGAGVTLGAAAARVDGAGADAAALTAAAPVRRFVGIWHPHGAAPGYWSPLQEGKDFEFSFITKPLEPFRERVVADHAGSTCRKRWRPTKSRAAIMPAVPCCCPARGRGATRSARISARRSIR